MKFLILLSFSTFFVLGMFENPRCAVTGGTDSGDTCKDTSPYCDVGICVITIYKALMCKYCKKTCCMCKNGDFDPCEGCSTATYSPPTTLSPDACADMNTDCGPAISECDQPMFHPLMCKYCRVSCFIFLQKQSCSLLENL